MWMISSFLAILFPQRCIGCGKNNMSLCERCIHHARRTLSPSHPYNISLFDFQDPLIKKVIHAIKYYHRKDLVRPLVILLAQELQVLPELKNSTIVPIPMPRMRKIMRGYNQAELIAYELSTHLSLPYSFSVLTRTGHRKRQVTTTTKEKRIKNQKGSFKVLKDISGQTFLLVDDVRTTGATLDEARSMLLRYGASKVFTVTLAH